MIACLIKSSFQHIFMNCLLCSKGQSPTWKTFNTLASHLLPNSISHHVSELQFPNHSINPFSPLLLCFSARLGLFFTCLVFPSISGRVKRLHKQMLCEWENVSKAVHCSINSSGVEIGTTEVYSIPGKKLEDIYFSLSQIWFSCP